MVGHHFSTSKKGVVGTQTIAVIVIIVIVIIVGVWWYAASPAQTPTPEPSPKATPTPSPTPSPAPSATPTITPTPTPTPTSSPTPSPTPTITPTPTFEWSPDGVIGGNEYTSNLEFAGGRYEVHWSIDEQHLLMAIKAQASGWVSIGFEPTSRMKDSDMIFGWVKDGAATVLDLFSTGATGPHPPDTELGGVDDILEYGGKEEDGYTIIEFKRKLDTGDEYDKVLAKGQTIKIIWAMSNSDTLTIKHDISKGSGTLTLD